MTLVDVKQQVESFIRTNFFYEGPPLDPGLSFMEAGIIDSTGVLELVAFLENTFAIKIQDSELTPENLDSLARLEAFVGRKRG